MHYVSFYAKDAFLVASTWDLKGDSGEDVMENVRDSKMQAIKEDARNTSTSQRRENIIQKYLGKTFRL